MSLIEFGICIGLAFTVVMGQLQKNPKLILFFCWAFMAMYLITVAWFIVIAYEGFYMIDALCYAYYQKEYSKPGQRSLVFLLVEVAYYTIMFLIIIITILYVTYLIKHTLTFYDLMVDELDAKKAKKEKEARKEEDEEHSDSE